MEELSGSWGEPAVGVGTDFAVLWGIDALRARNLSPASIGGMIRIVPRLGPEVASEPARDG